MSQYATTLSQPIDKKIQTLWKIENESLEELGWSREDKSVIDLWDRECVKVKGHFEIPIPRKDKYDVLFGKL
ncbi:hypothetical protein [Solemya velum gill symbiont]|uniref:hypothetical protein n=1 Tax=Solemya velum gill symbiont TaxID=2340 RepID=UPI001183B07C|nr:hypothetical protein [Solemya velum gill symbiont]